MKHKEGSIVACIAVFSCLFFLVMNFYLRRMTQIKHVEWDVATVTAGDYTVDMKINQRQYFTYMEEHSHRYPQDPAGYGLKKHLKHEIEDKLTNEVASLGFENIDRVRIADIQFSYKNAALINGLKVRG